MKLQKNTNSKTLKLLEEHGSNKIHNLIVNIFFFGLNVVLRRRSIGHIYTIILD